MIEEIIASTLFVSLLSLVGLILLPLNKKTVDDLVFFILSVAAGALFATAFYDLLPEAIAGLGQQTVFTAAFAGIISFFVLERVIHWHHGHQDHSEDIKPIAYLILIGDGMHNFFDGVAIAASYMASFELGLATTFAVTVHEIPHELSDYTMLIYGGFTKRKALIYNLISALTAIAGGVLFYYLSGYVTNMKFFGLAFTAGTFIYIAGTDLLPELHKEETIVRSIAQIISMIAGAAIVWFMVHNLGG